MVVVDLGRLSYSDAFSEQLKRFEQVEAKLVADTLILVEHNPVLTLGANFHEENLLKSVDSYRESGIDVVATDRGGDVTYHGPGQLVMYPIFSIERYGKDLHRWLRALEQTQIEAVGSFGLTGRRFPPHTGVWVGDSKIAAIGIKVRRWINLHGIALNCNNPLEVYSTIVPCGIRGYGVTTLSEQLGREVSIDDAKTAVIAAFHNVFGI